MSAIIPSGDDDKARSSVVAAMREVFDVSRYSGGKLGRGLENLERPRAASILFPDREASLLIGFLTIRRILLTACKMQSYSASSIQKRMEQAWRALEESKQPICLIHDEYGMNHEVLLYATVVSAPIRHFVIFLITLSNARYGTS